MPQSKAEPLEVPKEWGDNNYFPSEIPKRGNLTALQEYRKSAENFPAGWLSDEVLEEVDRRIAEAR